MEPLNILVVEDSPDDAVLLAEELKDSGFAPTWKRVETKSDYVGALNSSIDVIFSDFSLPQFTIKMGLDLLRERGLEIPFIIVSGTMGEEHAVESLKYGATDYVLKHRLERLGTVVRRALREFRERLERKKAEEELRLAHEELSLREQRLNAFFTGATAGLGLLDSNLRFTQVNETMAEINGMSSADHIGKSLAEVVPDLSGILELHCRNVLETARPILDFEIAGKTPRAPGETRYWLSSYFPIFGKSEFPIGVGCIVVEITEQKRAEIARRESELRFRQIAENIHEVFWITEIPSNRILYLSPAYEKIWGRDPNSLIKSPESWSLAIHSNDRERVVEAVQTKLTTGQYDEVYRIYRPDGSIRWIRDRAYLLYNENGSVYRVVGTAEDITEQQQLEAQLRQAQKLEAIGTLAGGIAHDFNNILGAMIGYVELSQFDVPENSPLAHNLKEVLKAGGRARDLIRQILAFSRQQEQQRIPVQLRHVVNEALKLLRAGMPSAIHFESSLSKDTPVVLADATQIHQIVMNLGTNAAHAMRSQTGVLITTLDRLVLESSLTVQGVDLQPGLYAKLSIKDTGHGMDAETLRRIFEPFFTTKPPGEGTGLGLSVVHGIMQSYGGGIDVASAPGEGTQFDLYFPAAPDAQVSAPGETQSPHHGNGERILFVDDEESLARLGQKTLERLGYNVTMALSPSVALSEFKKDPSAYALLVTDLTMPEMSGVDLTRAVLKIRPGLPVILASGFSGGITEANAKEIGICELLPKPLTVANIAEIIQRTLAARSPK